MRFCFFYIALTLLIVFQAKAESVFVCSDIDLISIVDENKFIYSVTEENERQHYIVKDSVAKNGDIVEFWTLMLETHESKKYENVGYAMVYFEVNFKTKKYREVSAVAYSCNMRTLGKYDSGGSYMPIPPNSVIGVNMETAIKTYKMNKNVK